MPTPFDQASSSGLTDLINAQKGTALNVGALVQAFNTLSNAILNLTTAARAASGFVTVTATYAIKLTDAVINCTTNAFTVTLPTAVGHTGITFIIKNSNPSVNSITLATTSGQTIDGSAPGTIAPLASLTVCSNGSNWIII